MSAADPFSALMDVVSGMYQPRERTLFLHPAPHPGLVLLDKETTVLIQGQKPDFDILQAQGWIVQPDFSSPLSPSDGFDHALMIIPRQHDEARHDMARALGALKPEAVLTVAGANDSGGKRIEGDFQALGLEAHSVAQHKSRVVQVRKPSGFSPPLCDDWLRAGGWQIVTDGGFVSRPGLFSWNRIDQGSALLMENIPHDLSGSGADFGCGCGVLAAHVIRACPSVMKITCVDADFRAVEAARKNVPDRAEYVWHDLTLPVPQISGLDFIVMNPPFHAGSATRNHLGMSFIRTAAAALAKNGHLYMVANNHLPYEAVLSECFRHIYPLSQKHGFKVIRAIK